MKKKTVLFYIYILLAALPMHSQTGENRREAESGEGVPAITSYMQRGIEFFGMGSYREAAEEFRQVQRKAPEKGMQAEALFWLSQAELAGGEYEAAVKNMEALEKLDPGNSRIGEIRYQKGRAFYYLGRYNDAILLLKRYADSITGTDPPDKDRKAAAYYWTGECLYALGLFSTASDIFSVIVAEYPESVKADIALFRLEMIKQKKVELELLNLLKWSHEESLKTIAEYQRRERSYDQALIAYQKRIADMLKDIRFVELEEANAQLQKDLDRAEERVRFLERELQSVQSAPGASRNGVSTDSERLKALRESAQTLEKELRGN